MFRAMVTADHLLRVVDAYREVHRVSDPRVSTLMFNDGKRIGLLRKGGDIGSRSLVIAFQWLSDRWPEGATWPTDVPRPEPTAPEVAA